MSTSTRYQNRMVAISTRRRLLSTMKVATVTAKRLALDPGIVPETQKNKAPAMPARAGSSNPHDARAERSSVGEELVLPGAVQAFIEAPIYARTNGYLKAWNTDIGTQVTKGQVLAEIETPEVDQQLTQALADGLHCVPEPGSAWTLCWPEEAGIVLTS